jgi:hypothetical protein
MSWISGTTRKSREKTYRALANMGPNDWVTSIGERILEQQRGGPRHDIANYKTVRKRLKRLRKAGKIIRITPTIYTKVYTR